MRRGNVAIADDIDAIVDGIVIVIADDIYVIVIADDIDGILIAEELDGILIVDDMDSIVIDNAFEQEKRKRVQVVGYPRIVGYLIG